MNERARSIAEILTKFDPLEPWFTESHWDIGYWDEEAAILAVCCRAGMRVAEVRAALDDVLDQAHLPPETLIPDRLDAIVSAIRQLLEESA